MLEDSLLFCVLVTLFNGVSVVPVLDVEFGRLTETIAPMVMLFII